MNDFKPLDVPLLRKANDWVQGQAALLGTWPDNGREWYQPAWRVNLSLGKGHACKTAFCMAGYIAEQDPGRQWVSDNSTAGHFDDLISTKDEPGSRWCDCYEHSKGEWIISPGWRAANLLGGNPDVLDALWSGGNTAGDIQTMVDELIEDGCISHRHD